MADSKFAVGDRVTVRVVRDNPNLRPGIYKVVRALPESSEGRLYRVKNVMDNFERVLREADLEKT